MKKLGKAKPMLEKNISEVVVDRCSASGRDHPGRDPEEDRPDEGEHAELHRAREVLLDDVRDVRSVAQDSDGPRSNVKTPFT